MPHDLVPPGPGSRRTRSQAGQATPEYVGVVLLVVAVLTVGVGVADAGGIRNGVVRGFERALCIVTGGDCEEAELEACTVQGTETGGKLGLQFTVVKLGRRLSLLREQRSDGSVDLTLISEYDGAPTAAAGATGGVRLGGKRKGLGAITQAELLVRLGRRKVWRAQDAKAADRLVDRIRKSAVVDVVAGPGIPGLGGGLRQIAQALHRDPWELPPAEVDGYSGGLDGVVEAGLGDVVTAKASLAASLGSTRERRTGRRTVVFSFDGTAGATLAEAVGGPGLDGSGGATMTLTWDRAGKPIELAVAASGVAPRGLGIDLPGPQKPDGEGGRTEVTATLDLRRDANRAVYDRTLRGMDPRYVTGLPGAVEALAGQLRSAARLDVRRTSTSEEGYGADGEIAAGPRIGGVAEITHTRTTLEDAWTRPAGGAWERRTDCLAGARS